jgi:glutaredoxin-like protein
MALLREEDKKSLREEFAKLDQPVKLIMFTQEFECQYCRETRELIEELSELSESVTNEILDFVNDKEVAQAYAIDKIPALAIVKDGEVTKDYGIRYFGIPSGYEFSSLINSIMMVGKGDSGLSTETKQWVSSLESPIHMQVFVTPTCPYCPQAVILAHQLAMESDMIQSDMVEAIEFPGLSNKYGVQGVPRTIINETVHLEGAAPESILVHKLQEAVQANA